MLSVLATICSCIFMLGVIILLAFSADAIFNNGKLFFRYYYFVFMKTYSKLEKVLNDCRNVLFDNAGVFTLENVQIIIRKLDLVTAFQSISNMYFTWFDNLFKMKQDVHSSSRSSFFAWKSGSPNRIEDDWPSAVRDIKDTLQNAEKLFRNIELLEDIIIAIEPLMYRVLEFTKSADQSRAQKAQILFDMMKCCIADFKGQESADKFFATKMSLEELLRN